MNLTKKLSYQKWTYYHSIACLFLTFCIISLENYSYLILTSLLMSSISMLLFLNPLVKSPTVANFLSTSRVLISFALLFLVIFGDISKILIFYLCSIALVTDFLDGKVARMRKTTNYGSILDPEADSFFTLTLCIVIYKTQIPWLWVLIPGVLRYSFVIIVKIFNLKIEKLKPTFRAKCVCGISAPLLTLALLPFIPAHIAIVLCLATAVLLVYSFSIDLNILSKRLYEQ